MSHFIYRASSPPPPPPPPIRRATGGAAAVVSALCAAIEISGVGSWLERAHSPGED